MSKCLTSGENLKHWSQKTDFTLFRTLWIPSTEADIGSAIRVHSYYFLSFFLHRPIGTSHTFQIIMMNPKVHLEVSLQAYRDRVNGPNDSVGDKFSKDLSKPRSDSSDRMDLVRVLGLN